MSDLDKSNSQINKQNAFKSTWRFFKDYFFNSDEKLQAWLYLIGATLMTIGIVAMMGLFAWWSGTFWAALTGKLLAPFLTALGQFAGILAGLVTVWVLQTFFVGKLAINWRNWLTQNLLGKLFANENDYLALNRFPKDIDNVSQRIQEDVANVTQQALSLGLDLLRSVLTLVTFTSTLWIIGGSLTLGTVVIPGYLVWVALILAVAATATTHFIGKTLKATNSEREKIDADFRRSLETLNQDAENISEEHAENYHKDKLHDNINAIYDNAHKKLNTETSLTAFQQFYIAAADIIPTLLAAPLYFSGAIGMSQLMQVGFAFRQVNGSLSWAVDTYSSLADYSASVARLSQLCDIIDGPPLGHSPRNIQVIPTQQAHITVANLNIQYPQSSTNYMMRNLNVEIAAGRHTLIQGPSGIGKSTLFKVISGSWKYGSGQVCVPEGDSIYVLPQRPSLPYDTLRAVMAYPKSEETYNDEQYIGAMQAVGGLDEFLDKLDERLMWSKTLSGGQQQRISFVRALLQRPRWLLLDEATASLDEEAEQRVYNLLTGIEGMTVISIAHRNTVRHFHSRNLFFNTGEDKRAIVREEQPSANDVEVLPEGSLNLDGIFASQ